MAAWKLPPNANGLTVVIRLRLERSGRVSDVRVEKSSGDTQFDASAVQAVRCASPFPPVPDSAKTLVGALRMVLDPTRPLPAEIEPKPKASPQQQQRTRTIHGQDTKSFVDSYTLKGALDYHQSYRLQVMRLNSRVLQLNPGEHARPKSCQGSER